MLQPVALKQRSRLAALLSKSMQQAALTTQPRPLDPRTQSTLGGLLLNLTLGQGPRLKDLAQGLWVGRATTVRSLENRLSYCLRSARYERASLTRVIRDALWEKLPASAVLSFRGLAVVAVDATPYPKRSRQGAQAMEGTEMVHLGGKGKQGRRARGYQDAWAALLLKNGETFPLARALSSRWGCIRWALDAACLGAARALRRRCLLLGDRGVGTKGRCLNLARFGIPFCFRIRRDWQLFREGEGQFLEEIWESLSPWGRIRLRRPDLKAPKSKRKRGKGKALAHRIYVFTGQLFSSPILRSPYDRERREPKNFWFVVALPWRKGEDPLILVTNLPIRTLKEAVKLLKLYEKRWQIEVSFETCKRELGLSRFMVRSLQAIERLLDLVMLAYALLVILLLAGHVGIRRLREEVERLLSRWSVRRPGGRLTVGKLKEGLALDGRQNREAWMALLQLTGEFS